MTNLWIDITKEVPKGKVLAINTSYEMLVGYCSYTSLSGQWGCASDTETIGNVTHFIPVSVFNEMVDQLIRDEETVGIIKMD